MYHKAIINFMFRVHLKVKNLSFFQENNPYKSKENKHKLQLSTLIKFIIIIRIFFHIECNKNKHMKIPFFGKHGKTKQI